MPGFALYRRNLTLILSGLLIATVASFAAPGRLLAAWSVNQGALVLCNGNILTALPRLKEALVHDSANSRAYYLLGMAYIAQGDSYASQAALSHSVELQPTNRLARMQLAELYLRNGQIALALEQRWEAMQGLSARTRGRMAGKLCPDHVNACVTEFDLLLTLTDLSHADRRIIYHEALDGLTTIRSPKDAERYAREAVKLSPQEAYFHWQLANSLLFNQPEEALREAHIVEELKYEPATTYELFGKIYRRMGRWEQAIEAFEESLEINSNNAWVHFWLGEAYRKVGREEEAIREWQAALRIAPGFLEARQVLESAGVQP